MKIGQRVRYKNQKEEYYGYIEDFDIPNMATVRWDRGMSVVDLKDLVRYRRRKGKW